VLKTLSKLFSQLTNDQPQPQAIATDLALAVLLYEVASADMTIDVTEQSTIGRILAASFEMSELEVTQLLAQAKIEQENSISIQTYTAIIIKNMGQPQRSALIQGMWQVAYADGELDGHEEYIIRKVSDLIYLSHSDYIKAKLQVIDAITPKN